MIRVRARARVGVGVEVRLRLRLGVGVWVRLRVRVGESGLRARQVVDADGVRVVLVAWLTNEGGHLPLG